MVKPLKKTETIEIRVAYETKLAFMARCRQDGVSASEALRSLIGERLGTCVAVSPVRTPDRAAGRPGRLRKAAGLVLTIGVAATALPSLAASVERIGFAQLDLDGNGGVDRAEMSRGADIEVRIKPGPPGLNFGRGTLGPASMPPNAEEEALLDRLLQRRFTRLDVDGNERIDFQEFRSR